MANEVSHRHSATGETLYFTIRNTARQMWNTAGTPNFETLVVANWGDYDVALSESPASSYFYVGTFPAISGNMVAGWYWVDIFKQAGGSPAISDVLQASFFGYWDGTTFKFWGSDSVQVAGSTTAATGLSAIGVYYNSNTMILADLMAVQNDDSNAIVGIHAMGDKYNADGYLADPAGVTTLLSRLTSSRAGYLDNLNVGGAVASQADINALNQSASRRVILTTVGQYERPESGSTVYTIEARTYSDDGVPMDATGTPTLTATGATSGDLAANLGSVTNPATGVYRWAYTVANNATLEPIRFDFSAVVDGDTIPMSVYTQTTDAVAADFTTADRTKLESIYNKLPSKSYLTGTANSDGDVQLDEATGQGTLAAAVRDVNNQTPAANSLGAAVNSATAPTVQQIVDGVLDEPTADHQDVGSVGKAISDAGGGSVTINNNVVVPAEVAAASTQTNRIVCKRGDTLRRSFLNIGNISTRTGLWFTVKVKSSDTDSEAVIKVSEAGGLLVLNGSPAANSALASITVDDGPTGDITLYLSATLTAQLPFDRIVTCVFDFQWKGTTDTTTPLEGAFVVTPDITRDVS